MARGRAKGNARVGEETILPKEINTEAIPYPIEVRMLSMDGIMFNNWKWEAKIEEIGLLAYGNTKEDVFKSIMKKYREYLEK